MFAIILRVTDSTKVTSFPSLSLFFAKLTSSESPSLLATPHQKLS